MEQQLNRYGHVTRRHHLYKLHGLRHRYARLRYEILTGWKSPLSGGPKWFELSEELKQIDEQARLTMIAELGHNKIEIAHIYLD